MTKPVIDIERRDEQGNGWEFTVKVSEKGSATRHVVRLKRYDYQRLTASKIAPDDLIRRAFAFLLEREPKESILPSFDFIEINRYFPDFEKMVHAS